MHAVNTDAESHLSKTLEKCFRRNIGQKKMYLEAYLQKRQHFSLFFSTIDELLGVEAGTILKMLDIRLAKKW